MAAPLHDAEMLAAWQGGETRLLYARHKAEPHAPLYYLEDGTARDVRAYAKEHLQCPVPDCPDSWLNTVARHPRKRDGFTHRPGAGGHAPESIHHLQGKALIERWVRQHYPDVQVVPEQATKSKTRRADVLLTWPSGGQVAIEVQYAGLSVAAWQDRHESYREQGIVDVWLLGHTRPHLRPARRRAWEPEDAAEGRVVLTALHHAILAAGGPLLWMHPEREEVGLAWHLAEPSAFDRHDDDDGHGGLQVRVPPDDGGADADRAWWTARPLSECAINPSGLTLPHLDALVRNRLRLDEINTTRRQRYEVRLARAEAAKVRKAEEDRKRLEEQHRREAALRERQERFRAWFVKQQPRWTHDWLTSDLRAKVLGRYGRIPPVLTYTGPVQYGVFAHPEHWRAVIYGDLVLGREPDGEWTVGDAYKCLRAENLRLNPDDRIAVSSTIVSFLKALSRAGVVGLTNAPRSPRILSVRVLGCLEVVAARREAEQAEREQYQANLRAARLARQAQGLPDAEPSLPKFATGGHTCRKCGYRLADYLAASGLHIGCRPPPRGASHP